MSTAGLYSRTDDVIEADVGGEVVLLHTQSWQYFEFDKVGGAIWNLLSAPQTLDAMVRSLVTQFEVDEEQCALETKAFLDEMVAQDLVSVSNG
ncbi:MAG TPA: PqqD family peptide modification chaperone [Rhizomicrobium sp.]